MKINTLQEAKQAAFNGAYKGLNYQKWKKSTSPGDKDRCQYNGTGGRHCGVGWLIPKDKYDEGIEDKGISSLAKDIIPFLADPLEHFCKKANNTDVGEFLDFLCEIQESHDEALRGGKCMKNKFEQLAKNYGLQLPKV